MRSLGRKIHILELLIQQRSVEMNRAAAALHQEQRALWSTEERVIDMQKRTTDLQRQLAAINNGGELDPQKMLSGYALFHELEEKSEQFVERCRALENTVARLQRDLAHKKRKKEFLEEKLKEAIIGIKRNVLATESKNLEELYINRLAREY